MFAVAGRDRGDVKDRAGLMPTVAGYIIVSAWQEPRAAFCKTIELTKMQARRSNCDIDAVVIAEKENIT